MPVGDSLATSFNQDNAEKQRSTHAKQDDQAAAFKRKTTIDMDRIQHTTVGNEVAYTKGQGTIVSKRGAYVTIYNKDANAYDQVHAGETYIPGDTISMGIMNQLWDQMALETRQSLLSKALVAQPEYYVGKTWNDLPLNLKEVLKLSPSYTSVGSKYANPPKGAHIDSTSRGIDSKTGKPKISQPGSKDPFAGDSHTATSGTSRSTKPTRAFRSVDGKPKDMTERQASTYDKKVPQKLRDDPSFSAGETTVGGKHLNQTKPDKTKKPAAQDAKPQYHGETTVGGKPLESSKKTMDDLVKAISDARFSMLMARIKAEGSEKSDLEHNALGGVTTDTPFDAPEDYEDDKRHQLCNEFQHEKVKEPKDNKQHEILTGKAGEVEKEGGAVTSGTAGVANAVYGEKEREVKNKYNTRYGMRQVSKSEAERFLNK